VRFLVLGSSGFLGSYLGFALPRAGHQVVGLSRRLVPYYPDSQVVADLDGFVEVIQSESWDAVVNCVALASHEACEANPGEALRINAWLPGTWAEAAKKTGAKFVHISTDAVFSGTGELPYAEHDETQPGSVYGQTKLEGEDKVVEGDSAALVLRTNFFGWSYAQTTGILDFFVNSFRDGVAITGFQDYVVSSIYMGDLVDALLGLLEKGASGTYHAVSSTPLSKYDFGRAVATTAGLSAKNLQPGFVADDTSLVPRGKNLGLSTTAIEQKVGRSMPSTQDGIERAFSERPAIMDYFGETEK